VWEDASRAPSGTGLHRKSTPAARRHHLIGRIVVCGHLATADLAWLALQAHPTAIDLRTPAEDGVGGLSFAEAHRLAVDLGIAYHHVPIARGIRSRDGIGEARAILRAAPGCVLLHCPDGLRAGALALIHLGCDAGRSLGECYTQAAKLPVQPPVEVWVGYILDEPYQGRPPVPERR
jgi:uncharacterized protein (TIGR01244 family)